MKEKNERFIDTWIQLTTVLNNNRMIEGMPYNEAIICRYLLAHEDEDVTATDLCMHFRMQKSQMNRTIAIMLDKQLIYRERSDSDKRLIFIRINKKQLDEYYAAHESVLSLVDHITDSLGSKRCDQVFKLFDMITASASTYIASNSNK